MPDAATPIVRILLAAAGVALIALTLGSAIRTIVLPRGSVDRISRVVFRSTRALFHLRTRGLHSYEAKDRVMALYAPASLLLLPAAWLLLVGAGYAALFQAVAHRGWSDAALRTGSLLTFGFVPPVNAAVTALTFSEAVLGLALLSLFIAYLPTMYTAFSRRELQVTLLESRAGSPPAGVELLRRHAALGYRDRLPALWERWEEWFVDVGETHTSLAALTHFRSPKSRRCWVTAAGAVLDAAALSVAALPDEPTTAPTLTIDAGRRTLADVAAFFHLLDRPWADVAPAGAEPEHGIHVRRDELEAALDELADAGYTVRADRDAAWRDFARLRAGYEGPLLGLCQLVMAPEAPWSSDRVERFAGQTRVTEGGGAR